MAIKSQVLADFIAEWTKVQTPLAIVDQELDEVLRWIADEIHRVLHLEGMPLFLPLYHQGGTDHLCGGCYV